MVSCAMFSKLYTHVEISSKVSCAVFLPLICLDAQTLAILLKSPPHNTDHWHCDSLLRVVLSDIDIWYRKGQLDWTFDSRLTHSCDFCSPFNLHPPRRHHILSHVGYQICDSD